MENDYTSNPHNFTYTFLFKRSGESTFEFRELISLWFMLVCIGSAAFVKITSKLRSEAHYEARSCRKFAGVNYLSIIEILKDKARHVVTNTLREGRTRRIRKLDDTHASRGQECEFNSDFYRSRMTGAAR